MTEFPHRPQGLHVRGGVDFVWSVTDHFKDSDHWYRDLIAHTRANGTP